MSKIGFFRLALTVFFLKTTSAEAYSSPRLWEVINKKPDGTIQVFHVLGVTHNGLNSEYDSYFYEKVIPVFKIASSYSFESAALAPELVPACPSPLAETPRNTLLLGRARALVSDAYYAKLSSTGLPDAVNDDDKAAIRASQRIFASQLSQNLSEYGLLIALKARRAMLKREQPAPHRSAVADYLFLNRGNIAVESIDTPTEMLDAYCGQNSARVFSFSDELELLEEIDKDDASESEAISSERYFLKSLERGALVPELEHGSKEYWDNYVCKRNGNWVKRITEDNNLDGKFFALGLAHLLPSAWVGCATTFESLEKNGMRIRLLE
ncbi:hypothetical protein [Duganella rhizosphaerae]|uniref:hypothetical protein n=1 Tax=Duganella rhizosphaerae TaxID=2885763 RepID=UPI00403FB931